MKKLFHILFFTLIFKSVGWGQTFPVQANTTLIPPYSVYLSDYIAPGSDRLALNIFLGDVNRPELRTRLRLRIEGQGILIQTRQEYLPPPMILQGGVPERLIAADLAEYFNPENLTFQGITRQQFERTGRLPEGLYQFCFEVLEYNRGVKVSNSACAMAWLILNDPPIINLPRNGEKIKARNPQYVTFQWTPRHTGSPNSAFRTEYEFSLVEIWPENRNPNDAMLTSPPIYETTTLSTTLIYGPAETSLEPGRHYAFRIRAKSIVGIDELDLFKNEGYSETYSFIYGDACSLPTNIEAKSLSSTRFKVSWNPLVNHTSFSVFFREADVDNAQWEQKKTYFEDVEINALKPGTIYEYRLLPTCATIIGQSSDIARITTQKRAETEFACGSATADFDLENKELIESLKPGDYIYSGDFDIKLDSVSGVGGTFSGGGKAQMPFLNLIKLRTVFSNIKVNTDYRVIEGNVYTYWDPNGKMAYDDSGDNLSENTDGNKDEVDAENDTTSPLPDSVDVQTPIDNIFTDSTGNVIVVTTAGDTLLVESDQMVVITDPDGETTAVGAGGVTSLNNNGNNNNLNETGTSNTSGTNVIADADVTFGPLSIKFAEPPMSNGTDKEGYCLFEKVKASFILTLEGQNDISKQVTIDSAEISFKKCCESNEYKDINIAWAYAPGLSIGKIKFIDVGLKSINIQLDEEGNLKGSLGLNASLNEDQIIESTLKVKKGINGDFSFRYDDTRSFKGIFLFDGIKGINLELLKSDKVLAKFNNGELSKEGTLTGDFEAIPGVVSYRSNHLSVLVDNFNANITYSLFDDFKVNRGKGQFTVSDIEGLDGSLKVGLDISEDIFETHLISSTLSGYGLRFSELNIRALMDRNFEVKEINGSFNIKHEEFNTSLGIQEFSIENGELLTFQGSGQIVYQSLTINITNSTYDKNTGSIVLDGNVEIQESDIRIAASVEDFTIDRKGNITFGGYNANVSGQLYFGPLTVALTGSVDDKGEKVDGKYREYAAEASFYLKMKGARGVEKEVAIAKGQLTYVKHKKEDLFREASLLVEGVSIPVGEIYGINTKINKSNIHISSDQEFSAFSENQANIFIEDDSYVRLNCSLTEDKVLNNIITLKKGLEGQIVFNFEKGKDFKGAFNFEGIKKLNLSVEKSGKEIAALKNGTFDKEGILKGKITGLNGVTYKSGGFDIKVDNLELGVSLNVADGWKSLKILSGAGKFSVDNIIGVDGQFILGMNYGVDGNFNAELLNKESQISAFGMKLEDLNLRADFNEDFELKTIEGSLKALHRQLNALINVSKFKLENHELTTWEAAGAVKYKNFNFELSKSSYKNDKLSINAKVEIENAGKLVVSKFEIDKEGAISIGKIEGELNKPMIKMAFNATFKDNGFKGHFNGDIKLISLEGDIDFGTYDNFNYGYLRMAVGSRQGIPLGPTGLQLTKVGGQLGFNYNLMFTVGRFKGSPKRNNYLIGLSLGISDMGNMFSAEGTSVVQFGEEKFQLNLVGNIKAPRSNPILESDFNVNYHLPDNILDGSLQVNLSIPANSGFVFQTKSPASLNFSYANRDWHVEGGVNAAMFREITFIGNTSLSKSEKSISGYIRGQASYSYSKSFNYDFYIAEVEGNIDLGFNSNVDASIDAEGIQGSVNVHLYGKGELKVETVVGSVYGLASVDCLGKVSYHNNRGYLKGEAAIAVQSSLKDFEESISIEKTF